MVLPSLYTLRRAVVAVVVHFETGYRGGGASVGGGCNVMLFGGGGGFDVHVACVFGRGLLGVLVARLDYLDELDGRYVACVT